MEAAVLLWFPLLLSVIFCNERLIVSGGHVISAYVGEEITLNCSVDSHIPPEKIEEVSWKKQGEDLLLLLYQEGEILTESTHDRFKGRVEFFSAEDRNKGNFSMRLKDVRTEDRGLYICLAFSGTLSDNTTVEEQQLGFSSMHIGILVLWLLGFVFGSVILGYFSYTSLYNKDNRKRHLAVQSALVLCLNITLSIGFILWGVTDGMAEFCPKAKIVIPAARLTDVVDVAANCKKKLSVTSAADLTEAAVVTHNKAKQTWQTDNKLSSETHLAAANDKLHCKFNLEVQDDLQ
ncbi:hypothetical protein C0J50_20755 [Silurus asotus]|uniref:Ig-like domain-containing protein n=1 Tax=Silurus asotus TaxID=30991 RepID=A0AAD5ANZ4_SILAS|nr:hypothetical protein C0J50_20755 [Silurus asotus]